MGRVAVAGSARYVALDEGRIDAGSVCRRGVGE